MGTINRGDAFTALMSNTRPIAQNLLFVLMAASALGAAHALSPGHGKTLVATSQDTFWHALIGYYRHLFSYHPGVSLGLCHTLPFRLYFAGTALSLAESLIGANDFDDWTLYLQTTLDRFQKSFVRS
ncbi:hypothetical protein MNBD_NITROSPIRAE01-309 [hydrothermal vent metagenome]|uniref:Uncharacterized protein n=1 Tax=hydrothermal vent metagenome TaxID=652676 RepID=A0A3B1CGU9_9ZZZZ